MKDKVYIGIDPGLKGFITVMNPDGSFEFFEMPVDKNGLNARELNKLIENLCCDKRECEVVCGVEEVHAIFGASASSTFNFGYVLGAIHSAVYNTDWKIIRVSPKVWQKEMWSGIVPIRRKSASGKTEVIDTKQTSILACHQLFPQVDLRRTDRSKKEDDNKCDSILITEFLRRKNF